MLSELFKGKKKSFAFVLKYLCLFFSCKYQCNYEIYVWLLHPRMEISISTDISVLEFYGYIENISMNIFT